MANKGYISVHRSIQDNAIWDDDTEKFCKRAAWIDLLLLVNHAPNTIIFDNKPMEIKRGQMVTSERKLAEKWHWSRDKVHRYLNLLSELGMITVMRTTRYTTVTIVNYEKFQDGRTTHKATDKTANKTTHKATDKAQTIMKNNVNNENKYIEPSAPVDEMTDEEWWAWANSEEADNDSV